MQLSAKVHKVDSISLSHFYNTHKENLHLELVNSPSGLRRLICEPAINRPGLALAGFHSYFANKRIQVFGAAELAYLNELTESERRMRIRAMLQSDIPGIVISRDQEPPKEIVELADDYDVCVFRTGLVTMKFVNVATIILEGEFADRITVHGCMVNIHGVGVLIRGKSGIGKSETALGLVERGASLIADDVVHIFNVGGDLIVKTPRESNGYMEVRGLGIVQVATLFGHRAVRRQKRLDLIVTLTPADMKDHLDRLGIERETLEVLGEKVCHIQLAVAPGRDTSRLVEVAAMDYHLKKMGIDMAGEFNNNLNRDIASQKSTDLD